MELRYRPLEVLFELPELLDTEGAARLGAELMRDRTVKVVFALHMSTSGKLVGVQTVAPWAPPTGQGSASARSSRRRCSRTAPGSSSSATASTRARSRSPRTSSSARAWGRRGWRWAWNCSTSSSSQTQRAGPGTSA